MKKGFLSILITLSIVLFTFTLNAVPYITPVNFMEIPLSDEAMNINALDDESCWSVAQGINLFNTAGWSGNSDFNASFKLCWDASYLYFYADITDDYNHSWDPSWGEVWMFDCIEFYIDLDTANHPSTAYDDNTIQLRFNRGSSEPTLAGRATPSDFLYAYNEKGNTLGWILEVGIPWTCVLPSGSLPEDINNYVNHAMGLEVNFADSDNADGDITVGNRDTHGAWDADGLNGNEDLAWNNTSVFGIVELLTEPPPPAIPYTPPVRTLEIPARMDRITFDGEANEASWSSPQDVSLFNTGGYSGTSDFDASFRLTWDMQYLYFFADITDDIEHNYHTGLNDSWMFDCIEFFIDLDTVMGTTAYDENSIQLRFNRGMSEVETSGRAAAGEFIYHWENKDGGDGWLLEAGIPWTCVMPEGYLPEDFIYYVNKMMGFDVNFSDSDNSDGNPDVGNRDVQAAWDADGLDGTEDQAWNNTHVFGIVDLIGEPLGPDPLIIGLPYTEPVREMDIPVMNTSFTLDVQDAETFWSYPQQLSVFNSANYSGDDDLKAYFRTAWDQTFLYLYASITDDLEQSWNSGLDDPWNYDNLEVYIDLDTFSMETDYRTNSTIMLRFNRGNDLVQTTGRAGAADFHYAWENKSGGNGWDLEAAIPWTCALESGASPADIEDYLPVIGFDIIVNDLDTETPGGRENITQAAWDKDTAGVGDEPLEDGAQTNTRLFGIANLSPYGLNPVSTRKLDEIVLYPNPACGQVQLHNLPQTERVELRSIEGKLRQTINHPGSTCILDISNLTPGIYLVRIIPSAGQAKTLKLLVH